MITGLHCNIYTSNFRGTMDLIDKAIYVPSTVEGKGLL